MTSTATGQGPGVGASVSERASAGRPARKQAPRSSHSEWEPHDRRSDPVGILEKQAETRVPELVPIRYGRMLVSSFTFYRGAAGDHGDGSGANVVA